MTQQRMAGDAFEGIGGFRASTAGTDALSNSEYANRDAEVMMFGAGLNAYGQGLQAKAMTEASKRQARAQQQSSGGFGGIAGGLLGSFLGPIGAAAGGAVGKLFG